MALNLSLASYLPIRLGYFSLRVFPRWLEEAAGIQDAS